MKRLTLLILILFTPLLLKADQRWIDLDMELQIGTVVNKIKDGWKAQDAGSPSGVNKDFTYTQGVSSATPSGWRGEQEELFIMTFSGRPVERLSFYTQFEALGNHADRYWQPIDDRKRMELSGDKLKWVRGKINYSGDIFRLEGFRGTGHAGWEDLRQDMFGFYPEQWEEERYRRVSGRIIPRGGMVEFGNKKLGRLTYVTGDEILWGYGFSHYAKYNKRLGKFNTTVLFKSEEIPYGAEDEKLNAWQLNTLFAPRSHVTVQCGVLFQPFRLHRPYTFTEDVRAGAGILGSAYKIKNSETDLNDAWGEALTISFWLKPVVDTVALGYKHLGITAGNKDEISAKAARSFFSRKFTASLGFVGVKPLVDPMPLLKDQVGGILASPRGEDSPFRVTEDPEVSDITGNREKNMFDFVLLFDPTPRTWFYQWREGIVEDWNINPAEDAPLALAFHCRLLEYPGTTDNVPYYNEDGNLTYVPADRVGLPPSKGYMPSFNWISVINLPGSYMLTAGLGGGQLPASTILADEKGKNYTNYLTSLLSIRKGHVYCTLRYERDTWGPEEFHRDFGEIIDRMLRSKIGYDFNDAAYISGEYIYARRIENLTDTFSIGSFDEIKLVVGFRFGALFLIDERQKRQHAATRVKKESETEARVIIDEIVFSPDGDGVADVIPIRLEVISGNIKNWDVTILDDTDRPVMIFSGREEPPAEFIWKGIDRDFGETVGEGVYTVKFRVTDKNNRNTFAPPVTLKVRY